MITKSQLLASLLRECDICKHLYTKLTPASFDYRPSPEHRTTAELLRYLTMAGIGAIHWFGSGDRNVWSEYAERSKAVSVDKFPEAMDAQKKEIEDFFASISEEELATRNVKTPSGEEMPFGAAIMNGPLKWLAAYKLQLFQYAKSTGAPQIGTANAWAGIDWRPR